MLALRGVLAVIFGIVALIWPDLTLTVLVLLFGAYALVDGIFLIIASIGSRNNDEQRWVGLLQGIAGVVAGILTFVWPDITALVLLYFIAAWALVTGVLEIVVAIQYRRAIEGEWLLVLAGISSIVFGLLLVIFPGAGALSLVWLIGIYEIFFGALLIVLAFRLRGLGDEPDRGRTPGTAAYR